MIDILIAILALLPVLWSHYLLGGLTRYPLTTRLLLGGVGLAFGAVCALFAAPGVVAGSAAFVAGIGAVHFPASIVLTIKHLKRKGY